MKLIFISIGLIFCLVIMAYALDEFGRHDSYGRMSLSGWTYYDRLIIKNHNILADKLEKLEKRVEILEGVRNEAR